MNSTRFGGFSFVGPVLPISENRHFAGYLGLMALASVSLAA